MANSYMTSLFLLLTYFTVSFSLPVYRDPPAVFIFGDSSADVGTNSYLPDCTVKANFQPHGIDKFRTRPTGRYSNGFITVDYICEKMGFKKSPPPFLSYPNGIRVMSDNFTGVNFASAGSGFLLETGEDAHVLPVLKQIEHFNIVRDNITDIMGHSEADDYFSESIYIISAGTNDMQQHISGRLQYTDSADFCARSVFEKYNEALQTLYDLGARKLGIISALAVGCSPMRRSMSANKVDCIPRDNELSANFYRHLNAVMSAFRSEHPDFVFSLGNTYAVMMNEIEIAARQSGMVVDRSCCKNGPAPGDLDCDGRDGKTSIVCENREKYIFWDAVHPTDVASNHVAKMFFEGSKYTTPINFDKLVDEEVYLSSE